MAQGDDWTSEENERLVKAYFALLERDLKRIAANEHSRTLNKNSVYEVFGGRSPNSVEWKMRNVSAIIERVGIPWIEGLKPASNYQDGLWLAVANFVPNLELPIFVPTTRKLDRADAPALVTQNQVVPDFVQAIVRKIDPAQRDEANRNLGRAGEAMVFDMEFQRLTEEMPKRAPDLKWVARDEGDGHGYDIRSFDERGEERFIEVKTTRGIDTTPFFISRNETQVAERAGNAYRIFRVFNYDRRPKFFSIQPPLEHAVKLEPQIYLASFR